MQNSSDGQNFNNGSGVASVDQNTGSSAGKTAVYNSLKSQGASNSEIAEIEAMGSQESSSFDLGAHDPNKSGASSNYSVFNLNQDELGWLGFKGDPNELNNPQNIGEASSLLLNGIRNNGLENVQDFTRDGRTGLDDPGQADLARWRNGQNASAESILQQGPSAFTDDSRTYISAPYQ